MNVVDCTIGVRIAPVSLSGLMPWWTSLLRSACFSSFSNRRGAQGHSSRKRKRRRARVVDVVRVTEQPNPGVRLVQPCSCLCVLL